MSEWDSNDSANLTNITQIVNDVLENKSIGVTFRNGPALTNLRNMLVEVFKENKGKDIVTPDDLQKSKNDLQKELQKITKNNKSDNILKELNSMNATLKNIQGSLLNTVLQKLAHFTLEAGKKMVDSTLQFAKYHQTIEQSGVYIGKEGEDPNHTLANIAREMGTTLDETVQMITKNSVSISRLSAAGIKDALKNMSSVAVNEANRLGMSRDTSLKVTEDLMNRLSKQHTAEELKYMDIESETSKYMTTLKKLSKATGQSVEILLEKNKLDESDMEMKALSATNNEQVLALRNLGFDDKMIKSLLTGIPNEESMGMLSTSWGNELFQRLRQNPKQDVTELLKDITGKYSGDIGQMKEMFEKNPQLLGNSPFYSAMYKFITSGVDKLNKPDETGKVEGQGTETYDINEVVNNTTKAINNAMTTITEGLAVPTEKLASAAAKATDKFLEMEKSLITFITDIKKEYPWLTTLGFAGISSFGGVLGMLSMSVGGVIGSTITTGFNNLIRFLAGPLIGIIKWGAMAGPKLLGGYLVIELTNILTRTIFNLSKEGFLPEGVSRVFDELTGTVEGFADWVFSGFKGGIGGLNKKAEESKENSRAQREFNRKRNVESGRTMGDVVWDTTINDSATGITLNKLGLVNSEVSPYLFREENSNTNPNDLSNIKGIDTGIESPTNTIGTKTVDLLETIADGIKNLSEQFSELNKNTTNNGNNLAEIVNNTSINTYANNMQY